MDAYLGLGGNLGDVAVQMDEAIAQLIADGATSLVARARTYKTKPLGPPGQPDYLNTAIRVDTSLSPEALLDTVKSIEAAIGRRPGVRWGPRPIDLDILIYGSVTLATERLTIPHKELAHRRFVLAPLADLVPDLVVPGLGRTVRALLAALPDDPESVRPA